ncbi:Uncharacterised protein [uncultured Clostridium sp.]|nr:Uncharacterised protein [uncultured Clostridium sp.]
MSRERNRIIKPFEKNAVVERNKNQSYTQYCLFALPAFCGFFINSSPFGELSYYIKKTCIANYAGHNLYLLRR